MSVSRKRRNNHTALSTEVRQAGPYTYTLTRRQVKNLNLRIRPNGTVAASAHPRVSAARVDEFVLAHGEWLERALAQWEKRRDRREAEPLPDRTEALARMEALCRQYLPLFSDVLGGELLALKIRDMTASWGVCHPRQRSITFALRLANKPLAAQEYVVVHELCHFYRADHSPAFWAHVAAILPDWKQRRALLR